MSQAQPPRDYERPGDDERDALAEIYEWCEDQDINFHGYNHGEGTVEDADGTEHDVPPSLRRKFSKARY